MKMRVFTKKRGNKTQKREHNKRHQRHKTRKTRKPTKQTKRIKKIKNTNKRQKNRQNKKIYKGGGNEEFIRNYPTNLDNIKTAIRLYSDKHRIDPENAEHFVNNQISPIRRQAARDLIDNTIYITLEEVNTIVTQLIDRVYTDHQLNDSEEIYFYTGKPDRSFYFLAVLAYEYILIQGYKPPIFIDSLDEAPYTFDEIGTKPIIILDDVSYSGSQLSGLLKNIFYDRYISRKTIPNIKILLVGLNTLSKKKLSEVPIKKTPTGISLESVESPFNLIYMPDRLYEPILLKIGIERWIYLNVFFSLYTAWQGVPYISLYLDHKIADEASTFVKALVYGPIVPSNYNYEIYLETGEYSCFNLPTISDKIKSLILDYNRQHSKSHTMFSSIEYEVLQHLRELDVIDRELNEIEFYPFINTCKDNETLRSIITDSEVKQFPYCLFMASSECITACKSEDCKELVEEPRTETSVFSPKSANKCDSNTYMAYSYFADTLKQSRLSITKAIELSNKVDPNRFRCPFSWYKTGELRMI